MTRIKNPGIKNTGVNSTEGSRQPQSQLSSPFDPATRPHPGESSSRAKILEDELREDNGSTLSAAPVYNLETKASSQATSGAIPLVKGPHCQIIPLQREPLIKSTPLGTQSQAHIRLLDLAAEEEQVSGQGESEDLHLSDDQLDGLDED